MGIFQSDVIHQTALQAAIEDMRKNKFLCEDAFKVMLSDPLLKDRYGKREIDKFKAFLDTEIGVYIAHRMPDTAKFPSITILCGSGQEDAGKDALGDGYDNELVDPSSLDGAIKANNIIAGPLTPVSFDSDTGEIELPSNINMLNVEDGMFVFDEINKTSYEIKLVMDNVIVIEDGVKPNLNNMTIRTNRKNYSNTKKYMWHYETDTLVLESTNSVEIFYLYTLVMYILLRYKQELWDSRGFAVSTLSYSGIQRGNSADDPNILFQREITIRGRVEHSVITATEPIVSASNTGIRIAEMKSPDAVIEQVNKQGWKGENDQ